METSCRRLCALAEFQGFFFHPTAVAAHRSEAVRLAERAVDLDHQGPAAYCALARAHMMHGDHSAAAPTIRPRLLLAAAMRLPQRLHGSILVWQTLYLL